MVYSQEIIKQLFPSTGLFKEEHFGGIIKIAFVKSYARGALVPNSIYLIQLPVYLFSNLLKMQLM